RKTHPSAGGKVDSAGRNPMKNLERRIEKLEERVAPKPGPRHILVTNVPPGKDGPGGEGGGYTLTLFPGCYVDVLCQPLTPLEVEELREKYRRDREITDEQS